MNDKLALRINAAREQFDIGTRQGLKERYNKPTPLIGAGVKLED